MKYRCQGRKAPWEGKSSIKLVGPHVKKEEKNPYYMYNIVDKVYSIFVIRLQLFEAGGGPLSSRLGRRVDESEFCVELCLAFIVGQGVPNGSDKLPDFW